MICVTHQSCSRTTRRAIAFMIQFFLLMNSDFLISRINALESWLESSNNSFTKLPLKLGGYLLLIIFMMISNLIALFRWPFAATGRLLSSPSVKHPEGKPIAADKIDLQVLLNSDNKVLVDFWAEWCGICVMMNGSIQKLAKEQSENFTTVKVNTVTNPGIAKDYGVKGLPTLILFENGEEVSRHAGALSYRELEEFVGS